MDGSDDLAEYLAGSHPGTAGSTPGNSGHALLNDADRYPTVTLSVDGLSAFFSEADLVDSPFVHDVRAIFDAEDLPLEGSELVRGWYSASP